MAPAYMILGNSTSDATTIAEAYRSINGSLLMAVNLAWLLYGCYLIQAYYFFNGPASKNSTFRFLVILSTCTGALHISFATGTQWGILVEHWGDTRVWQGTPWTAAFGPFMSAVNGMIVQLFFVSRILKLSKHVAARVSAVAIALASMLALSGSMGIIILFLSKLGANAWEITRLSLVMRLWSVSTVVCDVLIALTMSLILYSARSNTTTQSMQKLLTNLVWQSIETGTVTAVTMILFLVCYETSATTTGVYMIWEFVSGPLYGNVLVFVLNSLSSNAPPPEPAAFTSPSSILATRELFSTSWTKSGISV